MSAAAKRVEQLRSLNRLDDAEREARAALVAEPHDPEVLAELAAVLHTAHRDREGLDAVDAALGGDPEQEWVHRLRAALLIRLGRHEEALEAGYRSLSLDPEGPRAVLGYAWVLQRSGRPADARAVAERAVSLAPDLADAHLRLADICDDLGDRVRARQGYQDALRLDPQDAAARHDLALLDARTGRLNQALHGLMDAGALDPGLTAVLTSVTAVLWRLAGQLRIGMIGGALLTLKLTAYLPGWPVRGAALAVLVATSTLGGLAVRGLPPGARPVVLAALRTDPPLRLTYLGLTGCALIYAAAAVTGRGALMTVVVLIAFALMAVAVYVRTTRRRTTS